MARKKGNQLKKGVPNSGSELPNKQERAKASEIEVLHEEELLKNYSGVTSTDSIDDKHQVVAETKSKQKSRKSPRRAEEVVDRTQVGEQQTHTGDCSTNISAASDLHSIEKDDMTSGTYYSTKIPESSFSHLQNGLHSEDDTVEHVEFSYTLILRWLRSLGESTVKASTEWLERHKPFLMNMRTSVLEACHYVQVKVEHAYPIILKWIMHFVNIVLLLFMVWLDCTLRGIDSFLRMGTTSFFSVVWCSALSITAMVGIFKFLLVLAVAAVVGLFMGFAMAVLLMAICGVVLLWLYGSFWTTMLVIISGGLAFILSRERLALFIATLYSVYSAWASVGCLGLLFGLNLSFISSDVLIFFLRNNINERRRPNGGPQEQTAGVPGQSGFFSGDQVHDSSTETGAAGPSSDRRSGIPSTSGSDSEATSEDEVVRLLNCSDHYAALGLSRFENVDDSVLKREYRKKAMLVHPDKNMGNEKAAEAFKKLQNAYEVLLDSFKRKAYDDELRREELLNYFRQFQEASQKSSRRGFFSPRFARGEAGDEDSLRESRQIACRKCGNFHVWIHTRKVKSRARWCQECKDFHQAKDGDGWVEQSSHPLFFGMLQKVDPPAAYVCADSKIYNATEWYICQGMRCPVNSHKPSFHVNTGITSKQSSGRGASSGQRGGMPTTNMEETMTEDEFFEWLQNAVQAGIFDNFSGSTSESPSTQTGNTSKSGGGSGSSTNTRRKKRGKK